MLTIEPRQNITIDNITVYARLIELTDTQVEIPHIRLTADTRRIKDLHYEDGRQIIKNGKILIECNKDCENCPMHETTRFEVFITSHTFRTEKGHKCNKRKVYSETIEELPYSRQKAKWKIELRKQYEGIHEKFKYRRSPYITEESIKEVIDDIHTCMTPSVDGDLINEYGHKRLELEKIELSKNDYGYEVYHYGRMGDYGWSSTVRLHRNCNMRELESALRREFNTSFKVDYS